MSIVIAIDGPTASGKGTIAKLLAAHYQLPLMDTGLLYRQVAFNFLETGASIDDQQAVIDIARALAANYQPVDNDLPLRSEAVSQQASRGASIPEVRQALHELQVSFSKQPQGAILDGRDIGTVICPDAPVKLFITASAEVRAERRTKQLQSQGITVTYEAVLQELRDRDARDLERAIAPTVPASDALVIDTSALNIQEVLEIAKARIDSTLA